MSLHANAISIECPLCILFCFYTLACLLISLSMCLFCFSEMQGYSRQFNKQVVPKEHFILLLIKWSLKLCLDSKNYMRTKYSSRSSVCYLPVIRYLNATVLLYRRWLPVSFKGFSSYTSALGAFSCFGLREVEKGSTCLWTASDNSITPITAKE